MDDELESLDAIARILAELDPEVADRALRWAADRYGSGIYLSDEDLDNLDAASQVREELRKGDAPAPASGGPTGSGKARPLQPEAAGRPDSTGSTGAAGDRAGEAGDAGVKPLTRVVKESVDVGSKGATAPSKATEGERTRDAGTAAASGAAATEAGGASSDAPKEPEPTEKKDPGKPSFLDTQYRMSVAKNLIRKKEEDDDRD